jgi:dTDP-glucose 4,6-dehydratase/UDP-glucose 4-epimerase
MLTLEPTGQVEIVPFPPERKAIDIGDYYSDFSLIRRELGWSPKVGLAEGLAGTLAYYRRHHAAYWEDAA